MRFPHTLCMMHGVFILHTIISSVARNGNTGRTFSQRTLYTIQRISIPPHCHFERSEKSSLHSALSCFLRKRFPLFRAFSFPSQKHSRFLLSHIRRYTGVQERSLDFARDDVAEVAFSQHILYTGRGLSIPPLPSFRAQARNPPCTLFFLAPFAEGFQFYFVTHTTLYRCARKIEGFGRDDDTEAAFSQHILYTGRGLSIPPIPSFRAQREIFLARRRSLLLSLKVSHFPLSHIERYTSVQERSLGFARDDVA